MVGGVGWGGRASPTSEARAAAVCLGRNGAACVPHAWAPAVGWIACARPRGECDCMHTTPPAARDAAGAIGKKKKSKRHQKKHRPVRHCAAGSTSGAAVLVSHVGPRGTRQRGCRPCIGNKGRCGLEHGCVFRARSRGVCILCIPPSVTGLGRSRERQPHTKTRARRGAAYKKTTGGCVLVAACQGSGAAHGQGEKKGKRQATTMRADTGGAVRCGHDVRCRHHAARVPGQGYPRWATRPYEQGASPQRQPPGRCARTDTRCPHPSRLGRHRCAAGPQL